MNSNDKEILARTFSDILESGGQCEGMEVITDILDKDPEYLSYFISIFDNSDPDNHLVRTKSSAIILEYTFYKPAYDHLTNIANWTEDYFEEYNHVQDYLNSQNS